MRRLVLVVVALVLVAGTASWICPVPQSARVVALDADQARAERADREATCVVARHLLLGERSLAEMPFESLRWLLGKGGWTHGDITIVDTWLYGMARYRSALDEHRQLVHRAKYEAGVDPELANRKAPAPGPEEKWLVEVRARLLLGDAEGAAVFVRANR